MASLERERESERPDRASWSRPGDNKVTDDFEGAERVLLVARVLRFAWMIIWRHVHVDRSTTGSAVDGGQFNARMNQNDSTGNHCQWQPRNLCKSAAAFERTHESKSAAGRRRWSRSWRRLSCHQANKEQVNVDTDSIWFPRLLQIKSHYAASASNPPDAVQRTSHSTMRRRG